VVPRLLASPKQSPEQVVATAVAALESDPQVPLHLGNGDDSLAVLSAFEDLYNLVEPRDGASASMGQSSPPGDPPPFPPHPQKRHLCFHGTVFSAQQDPRGLHTPPPYTHTIQGYEDAGLGDTRE